MINKPPYPEGHGKEILSRTLLGRHGDITPRNILWFEDGGRGGRGVLKLADFSEARFYCSTSPPGESSQPIAASQLYHAPELDLKLHLTPTFDIWGLGCIYLEFVTWFFGGWKGVDAFAEARVSKDSEFVLHKTSTFYEVITCNNGEKEAKVKPAVIKVSNSCPSLSNGRLERLNAD